MNKPTKDDPIIVLYDGDCPVCSREIAHYRRRKGAENIKWIDASRDLVNLKSLGIKQQAALDIFHVRDGTGEWRLGVDGFLHIWSSLPAYRWLAWLVKTLRMTGLLRWGYRYFLRWRNRNSCSKDQHCSSSG